MRSVWRMMSEPMRSSFSWYFFHQELVGVIFDLLAIHLTQLIQVKLHAKLAEYVGAESVQIVVLGVGASGSAGL